MTNDELLTNYTKVVMNYMDSSNTPTSREELYKLMLELRAEIANRMK